MDWIIAVLVTIHFGSSTAPNENIALKKFMGLFKLLKVEQILVQNFRRPSKSKIMKSSQYRYICPTLLLYVNMEQDISKAFADKELSLV
jgi:hypothetical protein